MARCNFCDADFKTGPGDILLVCPYCGTAQTLEGVKFKDHYMIRVNFPQSDAQITLLDWCSKQLGAPQDIAVKSRFVGYELVFYPFWISRVDAHTTYHGYGRDANFYNEWPQRRGAYKRIDFFLKPESGQFTRRHEISIAGVTGIDDDVRNHPIPTRSKEYFSHAHAEEYDGKVLHSQISEEQAKEHAKKVAYNKQTELIMQEVKQIETRDDTIDVGETFLMHVPVWELQYSYGSRNYKASVAAATGYVIESKYPRSLAFRAAGIGFGLILLIAGISLIGLTLGVPILPPGLSVSGGLLTVLSLLLLYKGASRKEAKEEL